MTTTSLYVLTTKCNSYIGYYTGSKEDLIKYEWEGMDVNVAIFHPDSSAKQLMLLLKKYYDDRIIKRTIEKKDSYGFWLEKLSDDDIEDINRFIKPTVKQRKHVDVPYYVVADIPRFREQRYPFFF